MTPSISVKPLIAISVALVCLAALASCQTRRNGAYFFPEMQVGPNERLTPVGSQSLFKPDSGSYYFFFYGANVTSVSHMERKLGESEAHSSLILVAKRDGPLGSTLKRDLLLTGDFGSIYAEKTCNYNQAVESHYNSVAIAFFSSGYPGGYEVPDVLADVPHVLPPLT